MVTKKGKTWSARAYWYDGEGKKRSARQTGFRTKKAAETWVEDTVASHTGLLKAPIPEATTLKRLHDEYVEHLRATNASPRTVEFYVDSAKRYLPLLGGERVRNITPLAVQMTVDKMRIRDDGTEYRAATVRGYYRALRAVLNYGVKLGITQVSPCVNIDLPAEQSHEATIYSPEELVTLLTALREQGHELYWPVSFYVQNGVRRGEGIGVRWQDIDFATGEVQIRANISKASGKMYMKRAKTRSSEAAVILSEGLLEDLAGLRERRLADGTYRLGRGPVDGVTPWEALDPAEFVCLTKRGELFRPGGMEGRLNTFQRQLGLPESTIHDLRHTYGTVLAEAGVDVVTISKAMRHSSIAITSNQYISGTNTIRRKATEAMGTLLGFSNKKREEEGHV